MDDRSKREYIFRGQKREYSQVLTSLGRLARPQRAAFLDACTILRDSFEFAKKTFRFEDPDEWYALLRHHEFPTDFLDAIRNPEVAISFALNGSEQGRPCVIYAVPTRPLPSSCRFISTEFLSSYDIHNTRWQNQSGCVLGPLGAFSMEKIMNWDLLRLQGLHIFRYRPHSGDRAHVDNEFLLSLTQEDHDIVKKMWSILQRVISRGRTFPLGVDPYLRETIEILSASFLSSHSSSSSSSSASSSSSSAAHR